MSYKKVIYSYFIHLNCYFYFLHCLIHFEFTHQDLLETWLPVHPILQDSNWLSHHLLGQQSLSAGPSAPRSAPYCLIFPCQFLFLQRSLWNDGSIVGMSAFCHWSIQPLNFAAKRFDQNCEIEASGKEPWLVPGLPQGRCLDMFSYLWHFVTQISLILPFLYSALFWEHYAMFLASVSMYCPFVHEMNWELSALPFRLASLKHSLLYTNFLSSRQLRVLVAASLSSIFDYSVHFYET